MLYIYGGDEWTGTTYIGYGLSIYRYEAMTITYDKEMVFSSSKEVDLCQGGKWELVLSELHKAIPRILEVRKEAEERRKKEKQFVSDCEKYLVGDDKVYLDEKVRIVASNGFRIYERYRHKWLFWQQYEQELVYEKGEKEPTEGGWRSYIENLIARRKKMELLKLKKEKEKAVAEWEARPKPEDYIKQIHNV